MTKIYYMWLVKSLKHGDTPKKKETFKLERGLVGTHGCWLFGLAANPVNS